MSDTAYLVSYRLHTPISRRALVIAGNPIQAKTQAERALPKEGLKDVKVVGELRDRVQRAQDKDSGVEIL